MFAVMSNKEERPADAEPGDGGYLLFARGLLAPRRHTHIDAKSLASHSQSHNRARNTVVDDETSDASVELIALVICKTRRHRAKQRPEIDLKLAHN